MIIIKDTPLKKMWLAFLSQDYIYELAYFIIPLADLETLGCGMGKDERQRRLTILRFRKKTADLNLYLFWKLF